jgi:tRNA dimethylallyltransferase
LGRSGKVVFLVGANASGKSRLGVQLAERFSGEIVSADSRQVFRRLDLGAGKLSLAEMRGIHHHLVDVVEPDDSFSLFDFQKLALAAVDDILSRGRQPFVVGGTGLYIDSLSEGYLLVPVKEDLELRRNLEELDRLSLLRIVEAEQAEALPLLMQAHKRRLIRAVEIIRSGVRYADTRKKNRIIESMMIGVRWDRDVLRSRIHQRLIARMNEGMVEEVEELRRTGVSDKFLFSLGLEYRFLLQYLTGKFASKEELLDKLGIAIYQFSRRQMTWFRRNQRIVWLDGNDASCSEAAIQLVASYLQS